MSVSLCVSTPDVTFSGFRRLVVEARGNVAMTSIRVGLASRTFMEMNMREVKDRSKTGQVTVLVNQRPLHLTDSTVTAAFLREFAEKPETYEVWKVVKAPDPEGQLPVDDVQITGTTTVENGDRFRVVPPGTFGQENR